MNIFGNYQEIPQWYMDMKRNEACQAAIYHQMSGGVDISNQSLHRRIADLEKKLAEMKRLADSASPDRNEPTS